MSVPAQTYLTPPVPTRIDFGWIKQAWTLFSAQSGVWVGALLIWFLLGATVWVLLAIPTGVLASMRNVFTHLLTHPGTPPLPSASPYQDFARIRLFSILLAGIGAVFVGGLYRMALRQIRGEPISVANLFSALPQSLPLLITGIFVPAVLGLLEGTGLWLMHFSLVPTAAISAINTIAWLPALILPGLVMFAPLLVVDVGASAPEAILGSVHLLRGQLLRGTWFYVVTSFLGSLGLVLCGVGMLATYPIFIISIAVGYLALTQPAAGGTPEFDPAPAGVWPPPPRVS